MAASGASDSGSSRCSTPSRANSAWKHHGARTAHGVFTRVAQRLLALAAAVWRNWAINAPDKRSLIAYDH